MRKKILSLVLSAIIIAGFVTQPVQARGLFPYDSLIFGEEFGQTQDPSGETEGDKVDPNIEQFTYEMEIKTVVGLGWLSQLEAGKYNPKELVSKYDVYDALINMTKGSDVQKNINVSGDNATFEDLADIVINNLSLNPYVPSDSSFFVAGSMAGIFNGMSGLSKDAYVTREQLAKVLYNSLKIKQYEANMGKTPLVYEEGATVAESLGLEIMEGVITANEYIDFYSDTPLDEGKVAINKLVVTDETANAATLLGQRVTAYIKDLQEDPVLLYAYVEEGNPKSDVQIPMEDYITSNSTTLQYNNGNRSRKVELNPNARVLYNGRYLGQLSGVDVASKTGGAGNIQTIDVTDDGRADLVIITSFSTKHVESVYVGEDDFTISDSISGVPLKYDKNKIYCFIKNGEVVGADSVTQGMILYVAESEDQGLYMIYLSEEKIEGNITAYDDSSITVGDKVLQLNRNFADTVEFKAATVYLGYDGKVAYIVYKKAGDMQYGYIMSLACNTEESDEGVMNIRLFTMDGKETKYTSADKIWFQHGADPGIVSTVDMVTIEVPTERKTPKYVYDKLVESGKYQVIQFGLDAEGKISKIATAVDSSESGRIYENVFSKDYDSADELRFYNKYLGPRFKRSAKMTYMQVPADINRKGDIKYYAVKSVPTDQKMKNLKFYDASINGNMVNGLIVREVESSAATLSGSCGAGIVKEIGRVFDEVEGGVNYEITIISRDGEEVKGIVPQGNEAFVNAGRTTAYKSLTVDQLQRGDIILYTIDALGELTAFNVEVRATDSVITCYEDLDDGSPKVNSNLDAIFTAFTNVLGTETTSAGDVIFSTNTWTNSVDEGVSELLWNRSYNVPKSRKVLIYNRATDEITVGSGKDIVKGDTIFIQTNFDYIRQAYIIVR